MAASVEKLSEKIRSRTARTGVVGLGYVGLPLAVEFGKQLSTIGFDVSERTVSRYAACSGLSFRSTLSSSLADWPVGSADYTSWAAGGRGLGCLQGRGRQGHPPGSGRVDRDVGGVAPALMVMLAVLLAP